MEKIKKGTKISWTTLYGGKVVWLVGEAIDDENDFGFRAHGTCVATGREYSDIVSGSSVKIVN